MTIDQEKALELYVRNMSANILRLAKNGTITFDEAVYLLQQDLLEVSYHPYKYCTEQGIQFEEVRKTA